MKTLILTCSRDGVYCGGFVSGLMDCSGSASFAGWMRLERESDIPRARSRLLHMALAQPVDSFLWIDDDMVFNRAHFEQICSAQAEVVAGVYCKRRHEGGLVCAGIHPDAQHPVCADMVEVDYAGTGFLRMTRVALERIKGNEALALPVAAAGWTHFFNNRFAWGSRYLTEDYAFCENARKSGLKVWLHRAVRVGHFGPEVLLP